MVIHTVKERESIREIAKEYGIDEGILRRNNGLEREEAAVGEELAIRIPTRTHRMSASDTPERIALRYSVRARELYANNPSLKSGGREGELIAVKYSPPEYGAAPANGYIYGGCDSERLERVMPYLTYVTIAAAVADEGGIGFIFDPKRQLEAARGAGKIPLLRIYSKCRAESFGSEGFRETFIERAVETARGGGYLGIVLGGCYPTDGEFIIKLRKRMIGNDLILITEMSEDSPYEMCEYADGCVFSCSKYASDRPRGFKECEERIYSDFALKAESSKTFVDIPSLAVLGDGFIDVGDAIRLARRSGAHIVRDEDTLISEFEHKKQGRCRFTSLKNIKAVLGLANEYGFMGVSFDVMRVTEGILTTYTALFRTAAREFIMQSSDCRF